MAGRKKAKVASRGVKNNAPIPKDDGTRWMVINKTTGRPAYLVDGGLMKADAERLAAGLLVETEIKEIG